MGYILILIHITAIYSGWFYKYSHLSLHCVKQPLFNMLLDTHFYYAYNMFLYLLHLNYVRINIIYEALLLT